MRYILLFLLFFSSFFLFGQNETVEKSVIKTEIQTLEDTLSVLGFAIVNDSTPVKRFAACQKFIKTLVRALKHENSFDYPFEKIQTVSIQYAPDSSFRVFSWQLYVDINEYKYYGTIQMNEPKLKMFPLIDRSEQVEDPHQAVLTPDNWYGSLVYNIESFDTPAGKKYLLFGFDGYRFFTKRKFIDVLSFNNGKPTFGAPVFETENGMIVERFILEYGSDARVKLNRNEELDMIVFDHLVETASPYPGQNVMYIPDGDLDGLKLDNGQWKYVRRIFDQISEEAPRPEPVFNSKGEKGLFGKEKKQ